MRRIPAAAAAAAAVNPVPPSLPPLSIFPHLPLSVCPYHILLLICRCYLTLGAKRDAFSSSCANMIIISMSTQEQQQQQLLLTTQITTFHKQKPNTDGDGDGDMNRHCSDKAVTLLESRGEKRAEEGQGKHSRCTHANMYLSLPPNVIKQTPNCVRVCVDCKCGLQVDAGQTAANVLSMCSRGSLPENV